MSEKLIEKAYEVAKEQYAALGVDTERAMDRLAGIPISIHCWQGDDVAGFERPNATLDGGGIQATGNYPGKARTIDELRGDFEKAISLIPGKKRMNLHACYLDNGGTYVERDAIEPTHFQSWIDWAKEHKLGLDFNPTYFSHPKAESGFTLAHHDKGIREFWIEHGKRCRAIGAAMGKQLGSPTITNIWIPDGYKDIPVDRHAPRARLAESLDAILAEKIEKTLHKDAVESKLFGIGAESYTVGSHEFYLGYAVSRDILLCLDAGHYHPTEVISEKLSAVLCFVDEMLLHVSRPVRWDSDHVVILNDELLQTATEIVRGGAVDRVNIGLDFFDASINRVAAWVIGTRAMYQALTIALLEPLTELKGMENGGDFTGRLAMAETLKSRMWGAVWDMYCLRQGVPAGGDWMCEVKAYEKDVLSGRS
jgi:L-rhamnose isomerase